VEHFHLSVVDCGTLPLEYGRLWSVPLECGRLWSGPLECGRLWSVPLECGRLWSVPLECGSSGSVPQSTTLEWKCSTIYHTRVEVFHNLPHSSGSVPQSTTLEWKHAKYYTMDVVLILYSQKCSESNRFSLLVHLPKGRMNVTGRSLSLTISQFNKHKCI
jgi:hypothetical protein